MLDGHLIAETLADILAALERDQGLTPNRRRDLRSAVRRYCHFIGRDPATVPASISELRPSINALNAAAVGVTPKTLQNTRSNLLAALKQAGPRGGGGSRRSLSPAWQVLQESLPNKRLRNGLSRLLRFCSDCEIQPDRVDDGTVESFMAFVRTNTLVAKPRDLHRRTTRLWNEAADTISGWPRHHLAVPDFRPPQVMLPLEAFLMAFQRDVARYLDWLSAPDPFDERAQAPLKPRTVRQRGEHLRLAASCLVKRGRDIETIGKIADLVTPDAFKEIFRHYNSRNRPVGAAFQQGLAVTLIAAASHWMQAEEAEIKTLKDLKRRLPAVAPGMTPKNRTFLRQFDDPDALHRLLDLPGTLMREACLDRDRGSRAAIKAQLAIAIELLLNVPLRMANLIALRLGHSLLRPGGGDTPYVLAIDGADTKNAEPIEFRLPDQLTGMIDRYLADFHPMLHGAGNPHLFPGQGLGHKSQATLSQQIAPVVLDRAGLVITPHQFRHLAGWIYLRAHPGDYVTLQKLLGHKNIKTTMNAYAELDSARAAERYDAMIAEIRTSSQPASRPRRRR